MKKKNISVYHKNSVDVTLSTMPRFNAFQTGHGVHRKSAKHPSRQENKRNVRKEIEKY